LNAEETTGKNNNAKTQPKKSWLRRALSEPNAADWIIAAFTIVIGVVGIFQWRVIRGQLKVIEDGGADTHELAVQAKNQAIETGKANDLAKDALIKVQRAFVIVHRIPNIRAVIGDDGIPYYEFSFSVENSGTTPTRNYTAHINWMRYAKAMPHNFLFPDAWGKGVPHDNTFPVIGPRETTDFPVGLIPKSDVDAVHAHRLHIYIYGWIRYNNVFDGTPQHVTKFSYEVVSGGAKARLLNEGWTESIKLVGTGPRFNCFDEECKE